MSKFRFKTRDLVYIAILVALNIVCAFITVPFAIPFTLQTFAVFFSLFFLGGLKGTIVIAIYLLLGLVGVPIFSNFQAGIGVFLGPTGGYLIGFLLSGILYWILTALFKNTKVMQIIAAILALIVCYLLGTIWYSFIYLKGEDIKLGAVLMVCVVPYIAPDIFKIGLAFIVSNIVNKRINKNEHQSAQS